MKWLDLMPGLAQFRNYERSWLRGDVLAGLTVAAYLVPQVMAYATVAGLPPVVGLWAALVPLAVYVLLGSSRQLSIGPESTTALMTAAVLAPIAAGDPQRYAALAAGVAVLVGALCFLGGIARLGFLAELLSKPVLVGYMTGVAIVMIGSQLGKMTGTPVRGDEFVDQMRDFRGRAQPATLADAGVGRLGSGHIAHVGKVVSTHAGSPDRRARGDGVGRRLVAGRYRHRRCRPDPVGVADSCRAKSLAPAN